MLASLPPISPAQPFALSSTIWGSGFPDCFFDFVSLHSVRDWMKVLSQYFFSPSGWSPVVVPAKWKARPLSPFFFPPGLPAFSFFPSMVFRGTLLPLLTRFFWYLRRPFPFVFLYKRMARLQCGSHPLFPPASTNSILFFFFAFFLSLSSPLSQISIRHPPRFLSFYPLDPPLRRTLF